MAFHTPHASLVSRVGVLGRATCRLGSGALFARPAAAVSKRRWLCRTASARDLASMLTPIGRFTPENKPTDAYKSGQFFLHRRLGYRGVIVTSWTANVVEYEGDAPAEVRPLDLSQEGTPLLSLPPELIQSTNLTLQELHCGIESIKQRRVDVSEHTRNWYQALCHNPDVHNSRNVISCRSWTPIGPIEGADYVEHLNIMPYDPAVPMISHSLFDQLFTSNNKDDDGKPTFSAAFQKDDDLLSKWVVSTKAALQRTKVYTASQYGIRISIIPLTTLVLDRRSINSASPRPYEWCYKVIIQSAFPAPIRLKQRTWIIIDDNNKVEVVTGRGVVGVTPMFTPDQSSFQYQSRLLLPTTRGLMGGFFTFQTENNSVFHVPCPTCHLNGYDDVLKRDIPEEKQSKD